MSIEESQKLFQKIIGLAIGLIICTIAIAIVLSNIHIHAWGLPVSTSARIVAANSSTSIALAAVLLVLAIIGKANPAKNEIMAFVFGIITLICAAGIIADRAANVGGWIENLVDEIGDLPATSAVIEVVLRIIQLGFFGVIIGLAIPSIVTSINIIKSTKDATTSSSHAQPAATIASTPASTKFCSACGASLDAGALFCNKCGAKV